MPDPRWIDVHPADGCPHGCGGGDGTVNDHGDHTTCTTCQRPV